MKEEILEDIRKEIKEMHDKLERLETGKDKLKDSELKIEFDRVINNLYFRIMKLRKLINLPEENGNIN